MLSGTLRDGAEGAQEAKANSTCSQKEAAETPEGSSSETLNLKASIKPHEALKATSDLPRGDVATYLARRHRFARR